MNRLTLCSIKVFTSIKFFCKTAVAYRRREIVTCVLFCFQVTKRAIWRWGNINMRKMHCGSTLRCSHRAKQLQSKVPYPPESRRSNVKNFCIVALLSCYLTPFTLGDEAVACLFSALLRTPFFDDIPDYVDDPVILEVSIVKLLESSLAPHSGDQVLRSFNALARVDRVLKGSISGPIIKLTGPTSSCDHAFVVGDKGKVIGKPHVLQDGMVELRLVAQFVDELERQRQLRK
jgi:hypothetical protein